MKRFNYFHLKGKSTIIGDARFLRLDAVDVVKVGTSIFSQNLHTKLRTYSRDLVSRKEMDLTDYVNNSEPGDVFFIGDDIGLFVRTNQ